MLLEISRLLFSYVSVPNENSSTSNSKKRNKSVFEQTNTDNALNEVLTGVISPIELNYIWNSGDENTTDQLCIERDRFLLLLNVFGILCTYTYNREYLLVHLGKNTIEVYLAIYSCCIIRLDSVVGTMISADMSDLDADLPLAMKGIKDDFKFLISTTMVGIGFVGSLSAMMTACAPLTQLGVVPVQPWGPHCLTKNFKFQENYCPETVETVIVPPPAAPVARRDSSRSETDTRVRLNTLTSVGGARVVIVVI